MDLNHGTQRVTLVPGDRLLARRILRGDERAFRELFDEFFPRLYRFAQVRLGGNADDAREVVQITFCKAFERMSTYRGESTLYAWFCQICRNSIVDLARSRQREMRHVIVLDDDEAIAGLLDTISAPMAEEPENELARGNLVHLIQVALDFLPDRYGDVLEWKYIDGLSVEEIGVRLTISTKAAESCLSRARKAMREALLALGNEAEILSLAGGSAAHD